MSRDRIDHQEMQQKLAVLTQAKENHLLYQDIIDKAYVCQIKNSADKAYTSQIVKQHKKIVEKSQEIKQSIKKGKEEAKAQRQRDSIKL